MQSNGKITKRDVDALKPSDRDVFLWEAGDGAIKGFAVKVTPTGKKTFIFQYRMSGRGSPTKRVQIGEQGMLVAEARTEAENLRRGVRQGIPPATTRSRNKAQLISGLVDLYVADRHEAKLRSADEIDRLLKRDVVPVWGARPIASITHEDVENLLEDIKRSGRHVHANRVLAWVKGMFTFAVKKRMLAASPAFGIEPPSTENERERVLTDKELVKVWNAAAMMPGAFCSATHVLTLTGQRRSEVAELPRREIDLDKTLWNLPEDRAKNKQAHLIHLSSQAIAALASAPENSKAYYFSTDGENPVQGWSRWKDQLDMQIIKSCEATLPARPGETLHVTHISTPAARGRDARIIAKGHAPFSAADIGRAIGIKHGDRWGYARVMEIVSPQEAKMRVLASFDSTAPSSVWLMGMDPWNFHDLRRTMTTRLNEPPLSFPEHVVDIILNHRNKSPKARSTVKKIYNRALYMAERKAALDAWGRYVEELVTGNVTPSNVIQISERKV